MITLGNKYTFEQGVPHFHFELGPANYLVGAALASVDSEAWWGVNIIGMCSRDNGR